MKTCVISWSLILVFSGLAYIFDVHFILRKVGNGMQNVSIKEFNETRSPTPLAIVTYARSGSTFLGEIFRKSNEVFYIFEPLHFMDTAHNLTYANGTTSISESKLPEVKQILENILTCQFNNLPLEFWTTAFVSLQGHQLQNFRQAFKKEMKNRFSNQRTFRGVLRRLESECKNAKIIMLKTIRAPLIVFYRILRDVPETKIIHLIRDPRPTIKSEGKYITSIRSLSEFACNFCARILVDMSVGDMLTAVIPTSNIVRVRYENIATHPVEMTKVLYEFANITLNDNIISKIQEMTSSGVSEDGPLTTKKGNSTAIVDEWRFKIPFSFVQKVDNECGTVYQKIGFLPVQNSSVLNDTSVRLFFDIKKTNEEYSYERHFAAGLMVEELKCCNFP